MKPNLVAAVLAVSGCAAIDTPEACRVTPIATIPLHITRGLPLIDVAIGGKPARLLLDTGADTAGLTTKAMERLKIEQDYAAPSYSTGLGARGMNWATKTATLKLDTVDLDETAFLVIGFSADVPFDGVLGGKTFSNYDLDIDMPARRVTLNAARNCPGTAPFAPSTSLRTASVGPYRMTAEIVVDGITHAPIVDTGATGTILSQERTGLSDADLAADRTSRLATADPVGMTVHAHRFQRLALGTETVERPTLLVAKGLNGDGLLGTDVWRTRRVWLSYASRTVTVAPPSQPVAAPTTRPAAAPMSRLPP